MQGLLVRRILPVQHGWIRGDSSTDWRRTPESDAFLFVCQFACFYWCNDNVFGQFWAKHVLYLLRLFSPHEYGAAHQRALVLLTPPAFPGRGQVDRDSAAF